MNQAYVVLAHDLNGDDAEWSVFTGVNALTFAEHQLTKWVSRDGRWVGFIRPVGEVL